MSAEDVRAMIAAAEPVASGLEIVCVADVQARPVEWLWPGRIALGKLTLIVGDPGLGKSMFTLMLAANVTRGRPWPVDATECPLGSVLLVSAEDDVADTIRPRLEAAAADLSRVHCAGLVKEAGARRGLSLETDVALIAARATALGDCRLVIIDPVSAFLGATDSHNNAEVRGLLAMLAEMAARLGVAVVLVSHLNKAGERSRALYRPTGSLAFVAAARASYIIARDAEDPKRRLVLPIKNNLAEDHTGLAYGLITGTNGAPCLAFEPDPVTITADEALSGASAGPSPRDAAADWLRERLANGPVLAADVWADAHAEGLAEATVKRAKRQLRVVARKTKGRLEGGWLWRLPTAAGAREQDHAPEGDQPSTGTDVIPFAFFEETDPLRRGSLAEEDHRKALGEDDPLPSPDPEQLVVEI